MTAVDEILQIYETLTVNQKQLGIMRTSKGKRRMINCWIVNELDCLSRT